MFCQKCGSQADDSARFCPSCGVSINDAKIEKIASDTISTTVHERSKTTIRSFVKVVLVTIFGLALAAAFGLYSRNEALEPQRLAQENTIRLLKEGLRDPESLIIRSSYVVITEEKNGSYAINVCGIFAAKNSFGGYAESRNFSSHSVGTTRPKSLATARIDIETLNDVERASRKSSHQLTPFESVYWNEYCVDQAHPALEAT